MKTFIRFTKINYTDRCKKYRNTIIPDGTICFITDIPWYRSWFGLKPTRMVLGDGKTTLIKLRFI